MIDSVEGGMLRLEEQRILDHLRGLTTNFLEPSIVKNLAREVQTLMNVEYENNVANKRLKLEIGSNLANEVVFIHLKSTYKSIDYTISTLMYSNLYRDISKRFRKRKTLVAKREAYFNEMALQKYVVQPPQTQPKANDEEEHSVVPESDSGDCRLSIIRDLGRPSAGPAVYGYPHLPLPSDVSLLPPILPAIAPQAIPHRLDLPSAFISAHSVPHLTGPAMDSSLDGQSVVNGSPPDQAIHGVDKETPPLAIRRLLTELTPILASERAEIRSPLRHAVVQSACLADVPAIPVPENNEKSIAALQPINGQSEVLGNQSLVLVPESLPSTPVSDAIPLNPIPTADIPLIQTRVQNRGGLIIDQDIIIQDYTARAIQLTNNPRVNNSVLNVTSALTKKYQNALSADRLFANPAISPLFNPIRGRILTRMFSRQLITEAKINSTALPSQPIATAIQQLPALPIQQDAPGFVDNSVTGPSLTIDETIARYRCEAEMPPVTVPPISIVSKPTQDVPSHPLPSTVDAICMPLPPQVDVHPHDKNSVTAILPISLPYTTAASAAINDVAPLDVSLTMAAVAASSIPPVLETAEEVQRLTIAQVPSEIPVTDAATAVNIIPPLSTQFEQVSTIRNIPTSLPTRDIRVDFNATGREAPILEILNQSAAEEPQLHMPNLQEQLAPESYLQPAAVPLYIQPTARQPPRKDLKNNNFVLEYLKELWVTTEAVNLNDLLGPDPTKSDKVALVNTLLRLNNKLLVRLYNADQELWLTPFPERLTRMQ